MTLIDGDRIITAQLYDDEHEEFIEKQMSIIDYVNAYTDEGVTTADDVLDKIKTEIEEIEKNYGFDKATKYGNKSAEQQRLSYSTMMMYEIANIIDEIKEIIDKYKAESDHKCHTCKHYTSGQRDGSCGSYICKNYSGWESEG